MPLPPPACPPALRHLLIANAQLPSSASGPALPDLPHLTALLSRLRPEQHWQVGDDSPSSAHELAAAAAHGLPGAPHAIPWAAFESGTVGMPCAWLRPVHLELGLDHARLTPSNAMSLSEDESHALFSACAPLLASDGITAEHTSTGLWLAKGALLNGLRTLSPAQAADRYLTRAQLMRADNATQQRQLMRLLSELEMLLASHPASAARQAAGQWPVNALWIHGAGQLDSPLPPTPGVLTAPHLGQGQAPHNAAAHAAAWQAIDTEFASPLLAALHAGHDVRLTLSGPHRAITLRATPGRWWQRITHYFSHKRLSELRKQL